MQSTLTLPITAAKPCSERELVQRARTGDHEAISELYQLHSPAIYRYFYFRTRNHQIAEDLMGELFLQVMEALPRYIDKGRPFAAWLFRIARYRIIDYFRHFRVARVESLTTRLRDNDQEASEARVIRRLEHGILHARIGELTDDQKSVVQLRFFENYSLEETGVIMGKSAGAVKGLQHRALQQLAQKCTWEHDA